MSDSHLTSDFSVGLLFFTHLEAPWSPQIPGCSSSSPSPGCFEWAGPLSPTGPFHHLSHGSSPAAHGSSSPAGSWTWPFPCGSSATSLLCPTLRAGGRWPLPTVQQKSSIWILLLLIQTVHVSLLDTWFCSWIILSFEACEFWLIFLISSSCSFKVDTRNPMKKIFQWNRNVHLWNKRSKYLCFKAHVEHSGLPSFSKFRLFSASWSAFLWYSVKRCCSMILSFSSKDTLLSAFFLMFACETEWEGRKNVISTHLS